MSELKARMLGETMNEYGCDTKIYLKYEADKVIAEKDKELRHQKRKRCMAMARVCYNQRDIYLRDSYNWEWENSEKAYLRKKAEIMKKRHKRWLELAEKFKPNNSTAQ